MSETISVRPFPSVNDPDLGEIKGPYEILDLRDGDEATIKPLYCEIGKMFIKPRYRPDGKWIVCLRVFVPSGRELGEKDSFPFWWDVTAQTLAAQLFMRLDENLRPAQPELWKVKKVGNGPIARFSVEVIPLEESGA